MCQPSCANPPPQTCSFYRSCAEAKVPCTSSGYALGFGEYFCTKFTNNIKEFSPAGQTWVYSVMTCLQKALIPIVSCDTSCPAIEAGAIASHEPCYVESGVCALEPEDWKALVVVVWDKRTRAALSKMIGQAFGTAKTCAANSRFVKRIDELSQEVLQAGSDVAKASAQAILNAVEITKMFIDKVVSSP